MRLEPISTSVCRKLSRLILVVALVSWPAVISQADEYDRFAAQRTNMLRLIEIGTMKTAGMTGVAFMDGTVLHAIRVVPRHTFLPPARQDEAYENKRIELGDDLTLESPFVVALMNQVAKVSPSDRVLEMETGLGYHAAVLADMADSVYSLGRSSDRAGSARERLDALEVGNVRFKTSDSLLAWSDAGPFDVIIIKRSIDYVPSELVNQLAAGGRLILPLGPSDAKQKLTVITKREDGSLSGQHVLEVYFPPLRPGDRT